MTQASSTPVPMAWVVDGPDGDRRLEWDVRGATRYELVRVGDPTPGHRGVAQVAQASALQDLVLPDSGALAEFQYAVSAHDGGPLPLAVSAVGTGDPHGKADIGGALRKWQKWRELCPYKPDAKTPRGEPKIDYVKGAKRTRQPYTLTRNPEETLTFDPNVAMCFPGAIVQSRPAIEKGYLVSAQIEDGDRADLGITVDRLTGKKETASPPSGTNVTEAIGKVVGDDSPGSSNVVFRRVEAYDSTQVALELGVSGTYGGFSASLDISGKRQVAKNTIMVFLREKAFSAFCDVSTASALFKDTFTEEKLNKLVTDGFMGPDNPPLLVTSVIYGRIITFTLTSEESETDIKAAVAASYNGFAEVDANLKARYERVLQDSDVSIIGLNVTPDQIKELLTTGKLADSFKSQMFKSYGRIGYTLHTLDGVPAKMSETANYDAVMWGAAPSRSR